MSTSHLVLSMQELDRDREKRRESFYYLRADTVNKWCSDADKRENDATAILYCDSPDILASPWNNNITTRRKKHKRNERRKMQYSTLKRKVKK